jgi:hypothetical protein
MMESEHQRILFQCASQTRIDSFAETSVARQRTSVCCAQVRPRPQEWFQRLAGNSHDRRKAMAAGIGMGAGYARK